MHILPVTALQGSSTTSLINSIYKNVQRLKIWKDKIQIIKSSCKNTLFQAVIIFILSCDFCLLSWPGGANGMLDMRQEFQGTGKFSLWIIDSSCDFDTVLKSQLLCYTIVTRHEYYMLSRTELIFNPQCRAPFSSPETTWHISSEWSQIDI